MAWFIYNFPLNINSPSSYTLVPGNPQTPPSYTDGTRLCAIDADFMSGTDLPDLSTPGLQDSMLEAFNSCSEQFPDPGVPLRAVKMRTTS